MDTYIRRHDFDKIVRIRIDVDDVRSSVLLRRGQVPVDLVPRRGVDEGVDDPTARRQDESRGGHSSTISRSSSSNVTISRDANAVPEQRNEPVMIYK